MGTPSVTTGAVLTCSFGVAPSTLVAIPTGPPVLTEGKPQATIMDHVPVANIPPFGMCTTPSNPMVAAATSAALGVLTPVPCLPVTTAPWAPGDPTVLVGGTPALVAGSTCACTWGGVITIGAPGSATTLV